MSEVVEAAWLKILARVDADAGRAGRLSESFAALVRVAHAQPQLCQLYPWVGMWELHFSRCTEHRHTWAISYIGTLVDGRFYVEGPSRGSPRIAETDNPGTAVAMVIERLPPGCGPAFIGTSEELAAHETPETEGDGAPIARAPHARCVPVSRRPSVNRGDSREINSASRL